MVEKGDKHPKKFVLYKKIDEQTGRGEERLKIYIWQEDKENKNEGEYIEVFEERAAYLSKDNESDPRMKWQTRERILAIMCVDGRFYTGGHDADLVVETIPVSQLEQRVVEEDGKKVIKKYKIDQVSRDSLYRFRNALQTAYDSRDYKAIINVKDVRGRDSRLEVELSIPQWNPERTIVLPVSYIPETIIGTISAGQTYFGMVNIGCEEAKDVYVRNWEGPIPPVSDEEWGEMTSDDRRKPETK